MPESISEKTRAPAQRTHHTPQAPTSRRGRCARTPAAAPARCRKTARKSLPAPCRIEVVRAGTAAASDDSSAMRFRQGRSCRYSSNIRRPSGRYRRSYDKIPRPEAGAFDNRSAASDSKGALRADPSWDRRSNGACLPCKFRRPEKVPEAALPQSPFDRARPDPDGYIPAAQRKSPVRCCSFCTQPVEISQEALCDRVFLPQLQLADHIVLALV